MSKFKSAKDRLAGLERSFNDNAKQLQREPPATDALAMAVGYWLGYPSFFEDITAMPGATSNEKYMALHALNAAHSHAVRFLMREAKAHGLDGAGLWEAGRVCRELYETRPPGILVRLGATQGGHWPDALGEARYKLPQAQQDAIRDGDAVFTALADAMDFPSLGWSAYPTFSKGRTMHAELLSAIAAFRQLLKSNPVIRFQDESLSRELADLDGQIRLFSDRLNLQFPDVPMPETSPGAKPFEPFGSCNVPHFITYNDVSEGEIRGRKGITYADPVRCFLLSYEWESAFNTFVGMVQADKGVSTGPPAEPQPALTAPPPGIGELEAEPLTGAEREKAFQASEPAQQRAYLSFQYAESKTGRRLEDAEAHKLLDEEGISTDQGNLGPLVDYKLPTLATWARQLRKARKALGEQKYRRRGRGATRSIVAGNQIENQIGDD